jgi:hypothetical protein
VDIKYMGDSWFMMSIYTLACEEEGLKLWTSSTHVASSPAVGYHRFPEKTAKVHQSLISWYLSSNLWWAIWLLPSFSINFPLHFRCPWGQSAKNQSLSGPGGTGRSDAGHDGFDGQDGQRRGRFRAGILRGLTPQRLEVLKKILWVFHIVPVWISISHMWYFFIPFLGWGFRNRMVVSILKWSKMTSMTSLAKWVAHF